MFLKFGVLIVNQISPVRGGQSFLRSAEQGKDSHKVPGKRRYGCSEGSDTLRYHSYSKGLQNRGKVDW